MEIKVGDIYIFRGTNNTTRPMPICRADSCFKVVYKVERSEDYWRRKYPRGKYTIELSKWHDPFYGDAVYLRLLTDKKHKIIKPEGLLISNWWHKVPPEEIEVAEILYGD